VTHVHCPECGFQNLEAAKYCEKCGALLIPDDGSDQTLTFESGEDAEEAAVTSVLADAGTERTSIIVRSGGGRAGEAFTLNGDRLSIGRSPDSYIFLDDVTVSRRHAVLVRRPEGFAIEDQGSLNGTFVNRKRVDRKVLEDGDEVQIGKYKLTYLER
jgi:pSer/pThr/pTyr-binding forkhead associated (FHA) protein